MKRSFFLQAASIFIAFVLLFNVDLSAAVKAKNPDAKIPLYSKVRTGKLESGFTYFVLENKKPEKRVEIQLVTRAGSVQEEENQRGLAHFIEHMCFNGTKHFPKNELVQFLESTGVRFGSDLNAYTSFDVTRYTLTLPVDKPGMVETGIQVMCDWANYVSFDKEEIEKERGVILEEKRLRNSAAQRLQDKHFPILLNGSKYAERMPIGLEEVIKNAPRERFVEFYNDWYRPDLSAIIVVGDIDADKIISLIKEKFRDYKFRGKGAEKDKGLYPIKDNKEPLVSIAYDKELPYAQLAVYFKHPESDKSTYNGLRQLYKEQLVGQMLSRRLNELTQLPEPPFLAAFGGVGSLGIGNISTLQLISIPVSGKLNKGFEAALAELFRVDQHGFTASELKRTKEELIAQMEKQYNERDKTESINLAQEIYQYFDLGYAMPGIEDEFTLVKEFMNDIYLNELNQMVSNLISDNNIVITASLPESSTEKPTEKELLEVLNKARTAKYDPYVDDIGDKPLMSKIPTPGKITSTKNLKNFDIVELKLSNGARVLLKPTDYKNDQILFSCWSKGGASLYSKLSDYHNASNAADIIDECGLGDWSSVKLSKVLQGKIVRVSPYIGDYSQGMSGSTTPKDMETFFQVLNMQFTEPRKDSDAFKSFISKSSDILKNRDKTPENVLSDTLTAFMSNYDARKMPFTTKELNNLDLNRAFEIYKERFSDASNFTFLFVGSFSMDEIKPLIEKYIASLPSTNKKENWKDMGINMQSGKFSKTVKKGIEPKSTVRLVIKYDDKFDYTSDNILKVNMLKEILNIRLREEIREEKGGVYGIGIGMNINSVPTPSLKTLVYYGCDPTRVDELIDGVKEVFAEVQKNGTSKENLDKVKAILKQEYERNVKENSYWLSVIQQYDYTGRDLSFIKDYAKKIDKVTAKDIQDAAKKYLTFDKNFARVVLMPEDDD